MKALMLCPALLLLVACGDDAPPPQAVLQTPPPQAVVEGRPQQAAAVVPEPRPNPDVELAARVKRALEEGSAEIAQGVDVAVANGVVRLYGTVASRAARSTAEKIAASTPGVASVENKLVVVKGS